MLGDAGFYHLVANSLGAGEGFVSPELPGAPATALHPPLHPLVLALPSALGLDSWTAHRLTTAVIGAVTVALVGLLGRQVAGGRVGLLAALLAAVYPIFIRTDGAVMSESLYAALVAACLLTAIGLMRRPSPRLAIALGALLGLATLTRVEAALLVVLLAVPAACFGAHRRGLHTALACLAFVVVLLPWTVRNRVELGHLVPVSTNSGTTLAGANCAATYSGPELGLWSFNCLSARRPGEDEVEHAARLRRKGLDHAFGNAARLPAVMAVRALRNWDLYQPLRQERFAEGGHVDLYRLGLVAYYPLALMALAGAFLLRRRPELLLLLAPVAMVTLTAVAFYGLPRFRYAAEVPIVVLAAVAVAAVADRLRGRRVRRPVEAAP